MARPAQRKLFFSQKLRHLKPIRHFDFPNSHKKDTKNTLRMQKRILKSGKNCAFESKITKT
jgi:hypothetical protein